MIFLAKSPKKKDKILIVSLSPQNNATWNLRGWCLSLKVTSNKPLVHAECGIKFYVQLSVQGFLQWQTKHNWTCNTISFHLPHWVFGSTVDLQMAGGDKTKLEKGCLCFNGIRRKAAAGGTCAAKSKTICRLGDSTLWSVKSGCHTWPLRPVSLCVWSQQIVVRSGVSSDLDFSFTRGWTQRQFVAYPFGTKESGANLNASTGRGTNRPSSSCSKKTPFNRNKATGILYGFGQFRLELSIWAACKTMEVQHSCFFLEKEANNQFETTLSELGVGVIGSFLWVVGKWSRNPGETVNMDLPGDDLSSLRSSCVVNNWTRSVWMGNEKCFRFLPNQAPLVWAWQRLVCAVFVFGGVSLLLCTCSCALVETFQPFFWMSHTFLLPRIGSLMQSTVHECHKYFKWENSSGLSSWVVRRKWNLVWKRN